MSTNNKFEFLKRYIPGGSGVNDNWFLTLDAEAILESEKRLGLPFPIELKQFYKEIGWGMLRSPHNTPKGYEFYGSNIILPPHVVANFKAGILLNPEEGCDMSEDVYELLQPGDLPFFEIADSSSFMVMKALSENPNAVWSDCGVKIEDSLERFIWKLYYEDPGYYGDIIEEYYSNRN